jgi:hypothetical protein
MIEGITFALSFYRMRDYHVCYHFLYSIHMRSKLQHSFRKTTGGGLGLLERKTNPTMKETNKIVHSKTKLWIISNRQSAHGGWFCTMNM